MTTPYKFKSEPWTKVCMSGDCNVVPVPLLNEVRVGHTNVMTIEQLKSR